MEQQAREQAFITALVTEHFVLQSARSATIGEANGRAAIFLSAVSSALVAFGFLAQVATGLEPFVAAPTRLVRPDQEARDDTLLLLR
jgi:hypothetical protein